MDHQTYNQQVPDLVYLSNATEEQGCSLVLPSGRSGLPHRTLVDTGSNIGIIDKAYAQAIGLSWKAKEGLEVGDVHCGSGPVAGIASPVEVVWARGTPHECRTTTELYVLEGVGATYQLLLGEPQLRPHGAYPDPLQLPHIQTAVAVPWQCCHHPPPTAQTGTVQGSTPLRGGTHGV